MNTEFKTLICNKCGQPFKIFKRADGGFSTNRKLCDNCQIRPEYIERVCKKCGKTFKVGRRENDPYRYKNTTICENCSKPSDYREFVCKGCNKKVLVYRTENDFYSRTYCLDCKNSSNYEYTKPEYKQNKYGISLDGKYKTIKCQKCGKEFQVSRSNKKDSDFFLLRKYCNDCSSTIETKKTKQYVCNKCGKTFNSYWPRKYCDNCLNSDTRTTYCKKCGKEITLNRRFDANGKSHGFVSRKYCDDCLKAKQYTKICPVCNKEFTTGKQNQICCSWDCSCKQRAKTLKQTTKQKWGVDYPCLLPQCRCNNSNAHSKINIQFENKLKRNNIKFNSDLKIGNYYYDIEIPEHNIVIEINPTFTHSTVETLYPAINKNYHKEKTEMAVKAGYRCINIWDWDDKDKIIYQLSFRQKLYARKLQLKEISKQEANEFLDAYHLQNSCYGNLINLGLYQNEELIQVMTFGKPRYNKNYQWELLRLCTKAGFYVIGGAECLFKYFIKIQNPNSIISYCDVSKFTGDVYLKLGFEQITKPQPREHWCNYRTGQHITAALLLQKGYDNIFGTNYGKGTDNRQLMLEHNWLPIYDCGQINFVWKKN